MQSECERRDDAKIAAAATKGPKQIRILIGVSLYKFAVRQNDIGGEQIVDTQSAFAREMTDAPAQG